MGEGAEDGRGGDVRDGRGERGEAAEALAAFLDRESPEPLRWLLLRYGMTEREARARARAVDVFVLGVSARLRVLRDDLGDPQELTDWIADTVQHPLDAPWARSAVNGPAGGGRWA